MMFSSLQAGDLFQHSLIASAGESRPRNLWAAAGSLGFQSLVLLAVVVLPLFHTEPLSRPEMLTSLYAPPAAASFRVTTLRVPTRTYTSRTITLSTATPKTEEAPSPAESTTHGVVGGIPGGVVGAVPSLPSQLLGNTSSMPVLAKAIETAPNKRMRLASAVAAANLIHDVAPEYPPEAGRARIEGTVVLMAVIGKDGCVRDVQVKSGVPLLVQAAIQAVKQWRYRPYLLNGEPVEVDSQITINFTLSRG